jgi:hypothetical protein
VSFRNDEDERNDADGRFSAASQGLPLFLPPAIQVTPLHPEIILVLLPNEWVKKRGTTIVIPAQAGIQYLMGPSGFWIPAFAGMTRYVQRWSTTKAFFGLSSLIVFQSYLPTRLGEDL